MDEMSYQTAFAELQQIVKRLETEIVHIEEMEAMALRSQELLTFCRAKLRTTGENVQKLFQES
jgi:exodeoxyribonuclease VII small subunit